MNLYLHFPFCQQKCFYCDFFTLSKQEHLIEDYCKALVKEIKIYGKKLQKPLLETVYLGGGTPSVVDNKNLGLVFSALKNSFNLTSETEITIEANPDSLNKEKLKSYLEMGVNRLSMGVQAWQNDLLKLIGRTYKIEVLLQAYKWAREVGFKNINLFSGLIIPVVTRDEFQDF